MIIKKSDMETELRRELALRETTYERMIVNRKMTRTEANRRKALIKAAIGYLSNNSTLTKGFRVREVITEIGKELDSRIKYYPYWIINPKNKLTKEQANTQYLRLKAVVVFLKREYKLNIQQQSLF